MLRELSLRLGVSSFWKTEGFSVFFKNFSNFIICFYFLLQNWLRKIKVLMFSCKFSYLSNKVQACVSTYSLSSLSRAKKKKPKTLQDKILSYKWKKSENPRTTVLRFNRLGILTRTTKPVYSVRSISQLRRLDGKIKSSVVSIGENIISVQKSSLDRGKGNTFGFFKNRSKVLKRFKFKNRRFQGIKLERRLRFFFNKCIVLKFSNIFNKTPISSQHNKNIIGFLSKMFFFPTVTNHKTFVVSSLKKISKRVFKVLNTRWFLWKTIFNVVDVVNILNASFYFLNAETLNHVFCVAFLKARKKYLIFLKKLKSLTKVFEPIYSRYPISRSLRLSVFGKLGGQKKRRFKTYYVTTGNRFPAKTVMYSLDFNFKGIWNFVGSFGMKVWIFSTRSSFLGD